MFCKNVARISIDIVTFGEKLFYPKHPYEVLLFKKDLRHIIYKFQHVPKLSPRNQSTPNLTIFIFKISAPRAPIIKTLATKGTRYLWGVFFIALASAHWTPLTPSPIGRSGGRHCSRRATARGVASWGVGTLLERRPTVRTLRGDLCSRNAHSPDYSLNFSPWESDGIVFDRGDGGAFVLCSAVVFFASGLFGFGGGWFSFVHPSRFAGGF